MTKRKIVELWLDVCGVQDSCSGSCPYGDGTGEKEGCKEALMADALYLIRELGDNMCGYEEEVGRVPYCEGKCSECVHNVSLEERFRKTYGWLECCKPRIKDDLTGDLTNCKHCPYHIGGNSCSPFEMYDDALDLLNILYDKLHEQIEPAGIYDNGDWDCGFCGYENISTNLYCGHCGRKVKRAYEIS